MLAQVAQAKEYQIDPTADFLALKASNSHNQYLTASEVTTWKDWGDGVWRTNDTYTATGLKINYVEFTNWAVDNETSSGDKLGIWQRTSNITKYDRYSHPIEERSISGNYISSVYGYDESLPIAIVTGARRSEQALGSEASFIGFESNDEGQTLSDNDYWSLNAYNEYSTDAHTGTYSRKILSTSQSGTSPCYGPTRDFLPPDLEGQNRKYVLSCWVKTETGFGSNNGSLVIHSKQDSEDNTLYPNSGSAINDVPINDTQGKWVYYQAVIDLGNVRTENSIGGGTLLRIRCYPKNDNPSKYMLIDDIRLRPIDASMSTYTYNDLGKVTSITDENNITAYYEYDDAGRLKLVRDQNYNIKAKHEYHYARE